MFIRKRRKDVGASTMMIIRRAQLLLLFDKFKFYSSFLKEHYSIFELELRHGRIAIIQGSGGKGIPDQICKSCDFVN